MHYAAEPLKGFAAFLVSENTKMKLPDPVHSSVWEVSHGWQIFIFRAGFGKHFTEDTMLQGCSGSASGKRLSDDPWLWGCRSAGFYKRLTGAALQFGRWAGRPPRPTSRRLLQGSRMKEQKRANSSENRRAVRT